MKIFETIQLLLIGILMFGVPAASTIMPPCQPFSIVQALKQTVLTTAIILALLVINFLLARLFSGRGSTAKVFVIERRTRQRWPVGRRLINRTTRL